MVKNLAVSAGEAGDRGSIPRSGRSPAGGNGNLLQCAGLENSMDRGAWPWVAKRQIRLSD